MTEGGRRAGRLPRGLRRGRRTVCGHAVRAWIRSGPACPAGASAAPDDRQIAALRNITNESRRISSNEREPADFIQTSHPERSDAGSGVRQKAGLNRVIQDTGWGAFRAMLEYKAGAVVAVDPRNTSTTCAACGHSDPASRRSQAVFHCVACGHADHADANAARNIRRRGLARLHSLPRTRSGGMERGRQALTRSVKTLAKQRRENTVKLSLGVP